MSQDNNSIREKIRSVIPKLEDDGSKQLAESYLLTLDEAAEVEGLMQNKTFCAILDKMKADMKARLLVLIKADSDLAAMKRMFERTIGLKGAEAKIEAVINEVIENLES